MKKIKLAAIAILAFTISSKTVFAEENKYNIEPTHTSVVWFVNHFGFSNPSGKFSEIEGTITFDEKAPAKSAVDVTIKMSGLYTGLKNFEEHLKSDDFFNVKKFATAKFVSKKVTVTGKNTAKIEGDLTLVGVTKPVTLKAKFNKAGINPINQKQTVGFSATAVITRSEFGIDYAVPSVSDQVELRIEIEANR
ncbi:MAG: polyisoprenoid-binding protein [Rickettsiales bacterium]|nr:polyisoprenoid-binding protein [Rickettsiales bacterium]